MRPLTVEQVVAARRAVLRNARSLLDDAGVLLAAGRPPRAVSLALLAAEEAGKSAYLSYVEDLLITTQPIDWKRLGRILHSHAEKLKVATVLDAFHSVNAPTSGSGFGNAARALDDRIHEILDLGKQTGFYTFIKDDGTTLTPADAFTLDLAHAVLAGVSEQVAMFEAADTVTAPPGDPEAVRRLRSVPRLVGQFLALHR